MKPITLSLEQWRKLKVQLNRDYPKSVMVLRYKMREVLGFTDRYHNQWVPKMDGGYFDEVIHLDFYNEPKRTMFLLKYSEYVQR
jgi:hypothetical protein